MTLTIAHTFFEALHDCGIVGNFHSTVGESTASVDTISSPHTTLTIAHIFLEALHVFGIISVVLNFLSMKRKIQKSVFNINLSP